MNKNLQLSPKSNTIEICLGLGLGLGYMTSLRFAGLIGISELLILLTVFLLSQKHFTSLFRFEMNTAGAIKFYMFFSVFIVLPFMTLVTSVSTDYNTAPQYIPSFMMGIVLSFLLVEALKKNTIDMSIVVLWFATSFILSSLISLIFFSSTIDIERYSGAANNPNQLMFYASCLSLLLIIYQPKYSFVLLPIVIYITTKSGSDAYVLSLVSTLFVYIFLKLFFIRRFSFNLSFFISFLFLSAFLFYILFNYFSEIKTLWELSDEGNARSNLLTNALYVTLSSPLFGYGAGSYSGTDFPFSFWEAHNTFLDLGMQFGIIYPLIIYFVLFSFLINRIKSRFYMQSAFVVAFIISGVFHFTGRHFFFWVEFAIFYSYVFNKNTK